MHGKCMVVPCHGSNDPVSNGALSDGGARVHGDTCLPHIQPQKRYLGEDGKMSPKLQRGARSSPAKLWHFGRALNRVPSHVCIKSGHRVIPAEKMGVYPISALSWFSVRGWQFDPLPLIA